MTPIAIDFLSKDCRNKVHSLCRVEWEGLGLNVLCECDCHKKNNAADGFGSQDSAASQISSEVNSKEND